MRRIQIFTDRYREQEIPRLDASPYSLHFTLTQTLHPLGPLLINKHLSPGVSGFAFHPASTDLAGWLSSV
jgi:hypothetical protein